MEQLTWSITTITDTNWNALWESDFQPVVIDDFCSIRASFHPPETATKFDLVITPKMSFGTGHHATTRMMIRHMQQSNLRDASVLDFGSGTGILSILAEKMGAAAVTAIECDDQAVANAEDNFRVNHCSRISQIHDDQIQVENQYDIILANILLSVILKNLSALTKHLKKGGVLILSGLLKDDEQAILEATRPLGLVQKRRLFEEQWLGLSFEYQKVDESNFRR